MTENLKLTDERNYYKPHKYPWCYELYKVHEQMHWLPTEIPFQEDVADWKNKLSEEERHFLSHVFTLFTQSDVDVAGGYVNNYLPFFPHPEVRMMLMSFAAREAIHIDAYSQLIETVGMPEATYKKFLDYEAMVEKHEYIINSSMKKGGKESIALDIAKFSGFTEGMQLFSSFVMLLNFLRHGLMKGMGTVIFWSQNDENVHCEGMTRLFREYVSENPEIWNDELKNEIYDIAKNMVASEDKFIELCFNGNEMRDLTEEDVKKYIRHIADYRLNQLMLEPLFEKEVGNRNPLPWTDEIISAPAHASFFEQRVVDYAKAAHTGNWIDIWGKYKVKLDEANKVINELNK